MGMINMGAIVQGAVKLLSFYNGAYLHGCDCCLFDDNELFLEFKQRNMW